MRLSDHNFELRVTTWHHQRENGGNKKFMCWILKEKPGFQNSPFDPLPPSLDLGLTITIFFLHIKNFFQQYVYEG